VGAVLTWYHKYPSVETLPHAITFWPLQGVKRKWRGSIVNSHGRSLSVCPSETPEVWETGYGRRSLPVKVNQIGRSEVDQRSLVSGGAVFVTKEPECLDLMIIYSAIVNSHRRPFGLYRSLTPDVSGSGYVRCSPPVSHSKNRTSDGWHMLRNAYMPAQSKRDQQEKTFLVAHSPDPDGTWIEVTL
jgi:hypothetical protein